MRKIRLTKKGIVIIAALLLILIIALVLILWPRGKDNDKNVSLSKNEQIYAHTEEGIIKDEEYKGIKFSNISLLTKGNDTTFTANVTNVSDKDISDEKLHVSLKDKDGTEKVKLLAYIPGGLKKGETKVVTAIARGGFKDVVTKESPLWLQRFLMAEGVRSINNIVDNSKGTQNAFLYLLFIKNGLYLLYRKY